VAVLAEEMEVLPRLEQLGAPKAKLLDVVRVAVGAKRRVNPFYARNAAGSYSYHEGTAHLRRVFLPDGWEPCSTDNIEAIYNPVSGIKIVFQNADRAGDLTRDPLATSDKGAGSERAVEAGQFEFWPELRAAEIKKASASIWYLFVYANNDDVRAELSRPIKIQNSQFRDFHERILLIQSGEWGGIDLADEGQPPLDFEVNISRKG